MSLYLCLILRSTVFLIPYGDSFNMLPRAAKWYCLNKILLITTLSNTRSFLCVTQVPFHVNFQRRKITAQHKACDRIGKVTSQDFGLSYNFILSLSSKSINNEGSWFVLSISKPLVVCLGRLCPDLCLPVMSEEPPCEEWYLSALYLQLPICSDDKRRNHRKWIQSCV